MIDLVTIQRPTADCGKPVINLKGGGSCSNGFVYTGGGSVSAGSDGVEPFEYNYNINILGNVTRLPRKIERSISFNCTTQKATSARLYKIEGWQIFPLWKMNEIEELLSSKEIYIDDVKVVFRGDAVFEKVGRSCFNMYKLEFTVEECPVRQIYGCGDDCNLVQSVFAFKQSMITTLSDGTFDTTTDNGVLVNSSILENFLRTRPNVTNVTNVTTDPDIVALNSDIVAAYKVEGINPILPSYFHIGNITSRARVFPTIRPLGTSVASGLALAGVCDNINVSGVITATLQTCDAIVVGSAFVVPMAAACNLTLQGAWANIANTSLVNNLTGTSTLRIDIEDTTRNVVATPIAHEYIAAGGEVLVALPNGIGGSVVSVLKNGVPISTPANYNFVVNTGALRFTLPLAALDKINTTYYTMAAPTTYFLRGETVAIIDGACRPARTIILRNADEPSIPVGGELMINPDGRVIYTGRVTSSTISSISLQLNAITYPNT